MSITMDIMRRMKALFESPEIEPQAEIPPGLHWTPQQTTRAIAWIGAGLVTFLLVLAGIAEWEKGRQHSRDMDGKVVLSCEQRAGTLEHRDGEVRCR